MIGPRPKPPIAPPRGKGCRCVCHVNPSAVIHRFGMCCRQPPPPPSDDVVDACLRVIEALAPLSDEAKVRVLKAAAVCCGVKL